MSPECMCECIYTATYIYIDGVCVCMKTHLCEGGQSMTRRKPKAYAEVVFDSQTITQIRTFQIAF